MKYLVMECHPGYAVVLSDDGRFLKAANMHYEIGQTVTDIVEVCMPEVVQAPRKSRRWMTTLTTAAACLVLAVSSLFYTGQTPYASVYMKINPEVRVDVNRADTVVGVEGMNTDGETLLDGYQFKKKDLDLVMDELVDRAIDMGYLHAGGTVTLSLDADEEWVGNHSQHLSEHLNTHLTERIEVTVDVGPKNAPQPQAAPPAEPIVIPVDPEYYEHYGESDYDDDDDDDDDRDDRDDDDDDDDGDSGYEDGASDYRENAKSNYGSGGASDYEPEDAASAYEDDRDGESGYDAPEEAESAYDAPEEADSPYDAPEEAESSYDAPEEPDSPYDAPEEAESAYDPPEEAESSYDSDDGGSGYEAPEDDGVTDYGSSGGSDYEEEEEDEDSGYEEEDSDEEEKSDYDD